MKSKRVPEIPNNDLQFIPPEEGLVSSIQIWKKEAEARMAVAELKGIANIIPNQAILINAVVLQEAQDSSEIENIITTRDKLYQSISANSKTMDSQTKEVVWYREALLAGFSMIRKNGVLRLKDINKIQSILIGNNAGIRKTPGTSLLNQRTHTVVYTPPDPNCIMSVYSNLLEFFNTCEPSLINLAILHFQFESIHPYYDGNGRTGRLMNILYLLLKGFLDVPILYLSSYIIKNKNEYYTLLNRVNFEESWESWILFILEAIKVVSIETKQKVLNIHTLLNTTLIDVKDKASKFYSKELVEILFENPYCKIEFVKNKIGVERKAAARYLNKLSELGILAKKKIGKENIYINSELMKILKS
ncbi:MAG: Fic family protein [Fibrobacteria bacterium]|nr:Fic family protein [Fibrobacteria bacterium]